jgi:hypothetical protein
MGFRLKAIELQQINGKQNNMKKKNRVDMREQAVQNKQNIARKGKHPKRSDTCHAEACQNSERCRKAKQIQRAHIAPPNYFLD